MKKRISLLLAFGFIVLTGLSASACLKFMNKSENTETVKEVERTAPMVADNKDFEILPTMNTVSNATNQVWVGTFQLIWNDLIDEIIKHPVEFVGEKSPMADNLNRREFTVKDLSESSYYKKLGLASPEIKAEIEKGLKDKFNEKSDILDRFNWTPAPEKYILYAMLKKDFQYIETFDKLEDDNFDGSDGKVKYFGIDEDSKWNLRNTVGVLFYNNSDDFAVSLKSKQGDTVYLYRTNDNETFDVLYSDMLKKSKGYKGKKYFAKIDEFKAPMIEFKSEREFPELSNKPIKDSRFLISKAIETVQFKMDEAGVKLKSEAGMMVATSAAPGFDVEMPRYFYCDGKYIIFMLDKDKNKPYFALKVDDAKKLQK